MPHDVQADVTLVDSVTDLTAASRGTVAVTGSHGGAFSGEVAVRMGVGAAGFSDAGRGRDDAGIAGLAVLDGAGVPAFAVDVRTARIGVAADALSSGVVSHVNTTARSLGLVPGQSVGSATETLRSSIREVGAATGTGHLAKETRTRVAVSSDVPVWALDSASLVTGDDEGCVVVTGSHGGLPGGRPERALKVDAYLAAFNDAGVGKDDAGIARLAYLDRRGVAAVTVSAASARIGSGVSTYEQGVISYVNATAHALGCEPGERLATAIARIASVPSTPEESR